MTSNFSLATALCLSEEDMIALISGRSIAVLSRMFINSGQNFAICSTGDSPKVEAWAELISNRMYTDSDQAEALSWNTIWSREYLHDRIQDKKRIFLNVLRIHRLETPIILEGSISGEKVGGFLKLPQSITSQSSSPILNEATFSYRKERLENLTPPEHPELEELQGTVSTSQDSPGFKKMNQDIKSFLGWSNYKDEQLLEDNLSWIQTIDKLGSRSKEIDGQPKSNWQAGTDFENIVKKSLEFLGFHISETHRGGAGGLDFFCSSPYPLTGECKCGKKIPSGTTEELIKLGGMRLQSPSEFLESAKIIIGPGKPTSDVITASKQWRVSIIKPMTLQKLVEIHNQFPIDLIKLKEYLKPGEVDQEFNDYIEFHLEKIKLRSHVVSTFKSCIEKNRLKEIGIERFCGFFDSSNSPQHLSDRELYDILIELSSPLTGYLGRIKCDTWRGDRFYFLRDLTV